MQFTVYLDGNTHPVNFPDSILQDAQDFFAKMDQDMDNGWQMSRAWVDRLDSKQRAQVAADKLLTALETENQKLAVMMAAYICYKLPGVTGVEPDSGGDMTNTEFMSGEAHNEVADILERMQQASSSSPSAGAPDVPTRPPLRNKLDAIEQAGKEVTKAYKQGRLWKFSILDINSGQWVDGGSTKTEQEANELRMRAYEERLQHLMTLVES